MLRWISDATGLLGTSTHLKMTRTPYGARGRASDYQERRPMKRWPPIIWPAMAFAGLLLLMGLGAGKDWALISGVVLEVVVVVMAARLLLASWRGRRLPSWFPKLLGCLAVFYLGSGLAAAVAGTKYLPAVLLAALIPAGAMLLMLATAGGKSAPDGKDLAAARHDDPYPGIGADSGTPLGDTSEHSDAHEGIPPR
jgi:hypothetical protein